MAEQLTAQQVAGEVRTVNHLVRSTSTTAKAVDSGRNQLLPRARFALYQNRHIDRRHALDSPEERLHRGALADDPLEEWKVRVRHPCPTPSPPDTPADRETPSRTWGTP